MKYVFKVTELFLPHPTSQRKNAFTLAEILVTIGLIGVIAALTLPVLIQNQINHVVENRLKRFYSMMGQAVILAENEYGDKKDWYQDISGTEVDGEGNPIEGTSLALNWYKIYLDKYITTTKIEVSPDGVPTFFLNDGTVFEPSSQTTRDWFFFTTSTPEKCKKYKNWAGRCGFAFNFYPIDNSTAWMFHYNKGFEPWKYSWNGTEQDLYNNSEYGCSKNSRIPVFCSTLIQYNNWSIPKDYPFKVKY